MNIHPLRPTVVQECAREWDESIAAASEPHKKILRKHRPRFIAQGIGPFSLTNALVHPPTASSTDLNNLFAALHWNCNAFIRAVLKTCEKIDKPAPALTLIPGLRAKQKHLRQLIEKAFGDGIAKLHGRRDLSQGAKSAEITAIVNCCKALASKNKRPQSLKDLLAPANLTIIFKAYPPDGPRPGSREQILCMLAALANCFCPADDLLHDRIATERKKDKTKNKQALSRRTMRRLSQYRDGQRMQELVDKVIDAIDFEALGLDKLSRPPQTICRNALYGLQAAIFVLIAIYAPAKFELVFDARFAGERRPKALSDRRTLLVRSSAPGSRRRRSGASPQKKPCEPLERDLSEVISGLLDLYWKLFRRRKPRALFVTRYASLRSRLTAARSVENILKRIGCELTLVELRDLGVQRMTVNGETIERMVRAVRMSPESFNDRFGAMIANIRRTTK
jgi:hypothetical protein